ncbi:MAG: hypothetical protein ACREQ5_32875, partial [Candidatus Dormibacteria bacterium]
MTAYDPAVRNFCVGAAMQNDWGEDDWADDERPDITRQLLRRVFSYFRPHLRRGLLVTACIAAEAVIGLAPAVVFKALIDYLARPGGHFGHVAVLVGAGVGAALVGG